MPPKHTKSVSKPPRELFVKELESPQPAQCKTLAGFPYVTTLAIGEECFKGI